VRRDQGKAKYLYEKVYCARGDMENRIKECQLDLYADRTSTATMRANQLRLWFASMAYVLAQEERRTAEPLPRSPTQTPNQSQRPRRQTAAVRQPAPECPGAARTTAAELTRADAQPLTPSRRSHSSRRGSEPSAPRSKSGAGQPQETLPPGATAPP
jgi:hypothetical protein